MATEDLGSLVEYIARAIVDDPSQVQVSPVSGEATVIYELRVAPGDVGRVIGKRGRTANAIRTVLRAASGRQRVRASLEVIA